jgi:hypothetical protein
MGALGISNGVLNQKGSPAIYTDVYANRPAAGFNGRLFVSTDTSQIFEDNGTSWILIANSGIGSTGTLQVVTTNGNTTNTGITITAGGLNTNAARVSGLTQDGGVLFTDGSGNLGQDVNFNWDITNNYLGIGQTGTPTAPLDIHNADVNVFMQLNATSTNNSTIAFQNASVGKWRIGNLYSAGANTFHIYNNVLAGNALTITAANVTTFTGAVTAASLAIAGGTSSQFLKANGTTDSTAYISLTSLSATSPLVYNNATGAFTILQSGSTQSGYLSSTDWTTFNNKASLGSFSATTPLAYNSGTGAFTIQVANSGQSGYLTSTDWNTFNNKQSALTFGNLTESTSSVLTIAGGTGAVIGSGTTIQIKQSSASQNGYLSSTDWTTFNSKQAQINGTGFVKASGTTISYDNSTYYLASNPSNYITLSSLSGTTPISYNTGTGAISIAQSNTSTSGYLSSTDWNTFNSKASLTAFSASPPLSYNSGTGAFSISQASGSTNGYLSSTDWTTFNNKQNALTNPVTGTGTINYIPKFTATGTTIGNSNLQTDSNGNFGIGVTPSAWGGYSAIQIGQGSLSNGNSSNVVNVNSNAYYNGSNYIYIANGEASLYQQSTGGHNWRIAPSGTAGAAITWTQAMTLFSTGNLAINTTTDAGYKLDVNGTGRFSGELRAATYITLSEDATYSGLYYTLGFSGKSNGSSRIFADRTGADGIYIASATSTAIKFRAGGGTNDNLTIASTGDATFSNSVTATQGNFIYSGTSYAINATSNWTPTTSNNPIITFGRTSSAVAGSIGYDDSQTAIYIGTTTAHNFNIKSGSTIAATFLNSGIASFSNNLLINASDDGTRLKVVGVNTQLAGAFYGGTTSSQSFGLYVQAGTTSSDYALYVANASASSGYLKVTGDGSTIVGNGINNGQGVLQVNGGITANDISLTGASYSASATITKNYYNLFTGSTGQTLTLPSPLNNNYQYVIINTTANAVTIAAATSTNIITTTNTSVASFTLIANARCFIIADGSTKYYQVF